MSIPIVGIGASAGGLEALSELLGALPARCNAAFVVVQHLDPTHESLLTEILGRKTALPIAVARDALAVEAGHVYVIPPNATLTVVKGRLHLAPRVEGRGAPMPVDALFRSLAEDSGESAIGIVLSGADGDGALGTQAIKHAGGITFAQEPGSARFAGMPRSAIDTGCVDFILRPHQIAGELVRLVAHPYLTAPSRGLLPEETQAGGNGAEQGLRRVFQRLRTAHGVDFSRYKPSTLRRRLARRMALHRIDELGDYIAFLEADPAEAAALMARLATLVPPPRMHLTRYHGVFAPHSKLRAAVTPAQRGAGAAQTAPVADPARPPTPKHVSMSWARRLKRVFGIQIEGCARCGGRLKIIASIEEPQVVARILAHLEKSAPDQYQCELPLGVRAPPGQASLL